MLRSGDRGPWNTIDTAGDQQIAPVNTAGCMRSGGSGYLLLIRTCVILVNP